MSKIQTQTLLFSMLLIISNKKHKNIRYFKNPKKLRLSRIIRILFIVVVIWNKQ